MSDARRCPGWGGGCTESILEPSSEKYCRRCDHARLQAFIKDMKRELTATRQAVKGLIGDAHAHVLAMGWVRLERLLKESENQWDEKTKRESLAEIDAGLFNPLMTLPVEDADGNVVAVLEGYATSHEYNYPEGGPLVVEKMATPELRDSPITSEKSKLPTYRDLQDAASLRRAVMPLPNVPDEVLDDYLKRTK
jgi:hypothetical protein